MFGWKKPIRKKKRNQSLTQSLITPLFSAMALCMVQSFCFWPMKNFMNRQTGAAAFQKYKYTYTVPHSLCTRYV